MTTASQRAAFLSVALLTWPAMLHAQDKVVGFSGGDPVMNAAIAKARESLPVFWKEFASPQANEDGFALKVKITDDNGSEHFWCSDIQGTAEQPSCAIANDPEQVTSVVLGQRIDVEPALISDWMYRRDGKIVGGQTIRVIINTLPPDEAQAYRGMLAPE